MWTKFKIRLLFIIGWGFTTTPIYAQNTLEAYIRQGLAANDGLKQQQFQLDKSLYALKEARSYFLPQVSLMGNYIKSQGGRTIDFPTGDLLNGVYSTLNQLTGEPRFPQLENQSIQLNPDNFYDAKFRTTLQLVNAEIWYNEQIHREMITQQEAAVRVYKRELVKDIKTAYYHYLRAIQAVHIYEEALLVVNEHIRVNESLVRNGVRNPTALTRSRAEKERLTAQLTEAQNNRNNARSYFNFLLNKPLETAVDADTLLLAKLPLDLAGGTAITGREELLQIRQLQKVNGLHERMQQSYLIPKLNTFLDLGSQGFDWKFDDRSRYYMWGVNLQWDLFLGGLHKSRIRQARTDRMSLQAQFSQTERSFELQAEQAWNNYRTAVSSYRNAQSQQQLSEKYYQDQLKVYKEGQLLYIELLDAQNQLTGARLQASVAAAQVHIAAAGLERVTAQYPINQ